MSSSSSRRGSIFKRGCVVRSYEQSVASILIGFRTMLRNNRNSRLLISPRGIGDLSRMGRALQCKKLPASVRAVLSSKTMSTAPTHRISSKGFWIRQECICGLRHRFHFGDCTIVCDFAAALIEVRLRSKEIGSGSGLFCFELSKEERSIAKLGYLSC